MYSREGKGFLYLSISRCKKGSNKRFCLAESFGVLVLFLVAFLIVFVEVFDFDFIL